MASGRRALGLDGGGRYALRLPASSMREARQWRSLRRRAVRAPEENAPPPKKKLSSGEPCQLASERGW
jgi:hypothetical protein